MKIILDNTGIENFDAWGGAIETKETIINKVKVNEFNSLIEELYPDGLTDTQLNDLLRFEEEWIFEMLGIETEEEE